MPTEAEIWVQIDHALVGFKVQEAAIEFGKGYKDSLPREPRGNRWGQFVRWADIHIERANQWAEKVYGIYSEVWERLQNPLTPEFRRAVLHRALVPAIEAKIGVANFHITMTATRIGFGQSVRPLLRRLAREKALLIGRWSRRVEIEARELKLEQQASSDTKPATVAGAPLTGERPQDRAEATEGAAGTSKASPPEESQASAAELIEQERLERESNVRLEREIEVLIAEARAAGRRGDGPRAKTLEAPLKELRRKKEESDGRLATLKHALSQIAERRDKAAAAMYALRSKLRGGDPVSGWERLKVEFMALEREEEGIVRGHPDRYVRAFVDYKIPEQPEYGYWILSDGPNENYKARLVTMMTRAGIALGSPVGTKASEFWLHKLFLDLLRHKSRELFAATKEGGIIKRVAFTSATYCARLEQQALEQLTAWADATSEEPLTTRTGGVARADTSPEGSEPTRTSRRRKNQRRLRKGKNRKRPVKKVPETPAQPGTTLASPSRRAARGELCERVIAEVRELYREFRGSSRQVTFKEARRSHPDFEVLSILSRSPFTDDYRELFCHPRQWGVRPERFATGILKRHLGTDSDQTIRDYRKVWRRAQRAQKR